MRCKVNCPLLKPGARVALAGTRDEAGAAGPRRTAVVDSLPDEDACVFVVLEDKSRLRVPASALMSNVAGTAAPMLLSDDVALEYLCKASGRTHTALAMLRDRLSECERKAAAAIGPSFDGVTVSEGMLGGLNWTARERFQLARGICEYVRVRCLRHHLHPIMTPAQERAGNGDER